MVNLGNQWQSFDQPLLVTSAIINMTPHVILAVVDETNDHILMSGTTMALRTRSVLGDSWLSSRHSP